MYELMDPALLARLTAASHALGIENDLRELADDVASWDAEGLTTKQIDARIRKWGREQGLTAEAYEADVREDFVGQEQLLEGFDFQKLWAAYRYDEWLIECVRSLAFTDEPIPLHPFAAGFWYSMPNADPPMVLAVMTPLSDPDLAARQIKEKYKEAFGEKAARRVKGDEIERARMLAQHRRGMSHKEIAIQNLRDKYPDIVQRSQKYKAVIETEKSRVAKALKVAEEVWKERLPESSTPD